MSCNGAIGYVLINYDGIPVKYEPENIPAVQISALITDLVMKTKSYLKHPSLGQAGQQTDSDFVYLRMRQKDETELIVTNYISGANEYILVTQQLCKFEREDEAAEAEEK